MNLLLSIVVSVNWLTLPSTYTHRDGQRVSQYQRVPAPVRREAVETVRIRHYQRSWLNNGWSWDIYRRDSRFDLTPER